MARKSSGTAGYQTFKVDIQIGENFHRYHANGLYGGIGPNGELQVYITENIVSPLVGLEVRQNLADGKTTEAAKNGNPTRLVHASITFPLQVVPAIADWFNSKVKQAEAEGLLIREENTVQSLVAATKEELPQ